MSANCAIDVWFRARRRPIRPVGLAVLFPRAYCTSRLEMVLRGGVVWLAGPGTTLHAPRSIGCLPLCSLPPTARHYCFLCQGRQRDKDPFPLGQLALDCPQDVASSGPSLVRVSPVLVSGTACQRQAASTLMVEQVCAVQSRQAHGVWGNNLVSSVPSDTIALAL